MACESVSPSLLPSVLLYSICKSEIFPSLKNADVVDFDNVKDFRHRALARDDTVLNVPCPASFVIFIFVLSLVNSQYVNH